MFCPSCGAEYNQKIKFCKNCGGNLSLHSNLVEVNIPKPPISSMIWATVLFGFIGGLISLILFVWSITVDFGVWRYKEARVGIASFISLLFTCLVTFSLLLQLGRFIRDFREISRQAIKNEQLENNASAQAALPQQQPYMPTATV